MENRENLRVRQTRQRLSEALLEMLADQSLRSVSIRELCQKAGINRTTFYHHYGSQYDLFEEICAQFLEDIAACLASADPENREHVHEKVALVLTYLQDHLQVARLLLNHSEMPGFADRLFSLPKVSDLLEASLRGCTDPERREATMAFAIHGSFHLLTEWINREKRATPEKESALILELAGRVCRS